MRATAFEVIAYRAFALAIALIGVSLAYRIARGLQLSPGWSALAAALAFSLFSFPAYTYNHWLTTLANLAAIACVQRAMLGEPRRWLFIAGLCVGASVLVKPIPIGVGKGPLCVPWSASSTTTTSPVAKNLKSSRCMS